MSYFVIALVALCNGEAVALCNNRSSHFVIKNNNDNNNVVFTPTSAFKIFLGKYNSLYADDLDREKVSTSMTGRVV